MIKFEELEVLVRIVEANGIGKAAQQLGITKSMASRRLADLEECLGLRLFHRSTRSLSLTEEGANCYQRALEILDRLAELEMSVDNGRQRLKGTLRITIPMDFGLKYLSPVIDAFSREHPEVKFDIDVSNGVVDLMKEGTDLAIRMGMGLSDSSLKARLLFKGRAILVASPDYLERHGPIEAPEDLQHHQYIRYRANGPAHLPLEDSQGKVVIAKISPHMSTNNGLFANEMLVLGHGVSLMPPFISEAALADGSLVRVLPEYQSAEGYIHAVYPENRFLPLRVRRFIDFLVEHFANTLP